MKAAYWIVRLLLGEAFSRIGRALGWATKNPWKAAAIAFALIGFKLWHGGEQARAERDALALELQATIDAQENAGQLQAAANQVPVLASRTIAEMSRAQEQTIYAAGRAAGAAYAAAHRVRPQADTACAVGAADLPGTDRASPVDDGPGDDAELVAVTRADFDICTDNSGRLGQVRADAHALIAAGAAVAAEPDLP